MENLKRRETELETENVKRAKTAHVDHFEEGLKWNSGAENGEAGNWKCGKVMETNSKTHPISLPALIYLAFKNSTSDTLTTNGIAEFIKEHFLCIEEDDSLSRKLTYYLINERCFKICSDGRSWELDRRAIYSLKEIKRQLLSSMLTSTYTIITSMKNPRDLEKLILAKMGTPDKRLTNKVECCLGIWASVTDMNTQDKGVSECVILDECKSLHDQGTAKSTERIQFQRSHSFKEMFTRAKELRKQKAFYPKPDLLFIDLVVLALLNMKRRRGTYMDICGFLIIHFPHFERLRFNSWLESVGECLTNDAIAELNTNVHKQFFNKYWALKNRPQTKALKVKLECKMELNKDNLLKSMRYPEYFDLMIDGKLETEVGKKLMQGEKTYCICMEPYLSRNQVEKMTVSIGNPEGTTSFSDNTPYTSKEGETRRYPKPQLSYPQMLFLAVINAEDRCLTFNSAYNFILKHFPFFETESVWKNSVRNVFNSGIFFKVKGVIDLSDYLQEDTLWTFKDDNSVKFLEKRLLEKIKKYKKNTLDSMRYPEKLDLMIKGELGKEEGKLEKVLAEVEGFLKDDEGEEEVDFPSGNPEEHCRKQLPQHSQLSKEVCDKGEMELIFCIDNSDVENILSLPVKTKQIRFSPLKIKVFKTNGQ